MKHYINICVPHGMGDLSPNLACHANRSSFVVLSDLLQQLLVELQ